MAEQGDRHSEIRVEASQRIIIRPEQISIPIPIDYWDALKERLVACRATNQPWSIAYSIAFGIAITSGLSIAPIAVSTLDSWVVTLYAVICGAALSSAIVLVIAERVLVRRQSSQIDDLVFEMDRTRETFIPLELEDG